MADNTQQVVWTACPAGLTGDRKFYRIDLHVSPRLVMGSPGDGELGDFGAWRDWPATLATAKFRLFGAGPDPIEARIADGAGPWPALDSDDSFVPDSDVWQLLFPKNTPVISHVFDDFRGRDVLTYPMAALADAIETTYAGLALVAGDALPTVQDFKRLPLFGTKRETPNLGALLDLLRQTDNDKVLADNPALMLALLAAYHKPLAKVVPGNLKKRMVGGAPDPLDPNEDVEWQTVERVPMPEADEFRKNLDFHRVAAAVGQHPVLQRLTGLVVPLLVPAERVPPGNWQIGVEVRWDPQGTEAPGDTFCETLARVSDRGFRSRATGQQLVEGWLRSDKDFALVQLDVDGAGLTVKNMATQLPRMIEERFDDEIPRDPVARTGAPRLRTAGIQFAQTRRDIAIRGLFDKAGNHDDRMNNGQTVVLSAEDLVKGWRIDVLDRTRDGNGTGNGWQSLMRFEGRYGFVADGREVRTSDEEAIARLAAAETADDNASAATKNILKASEALFGWTGWSLAAPPPGRTMLPDYAETDDVPMKEEPGDAPNTVPPGLPLATEFRAQPKSLPVLRFGHVYQVRLRSVDLAGGGPRFTRRDIDLPGVASAGVQFGRYEPLETPVLTVIDGDPAPAEGESMPRAALRSMLAPHESTTIVRRNVHPARVGHRFAELHGVIDSPQGTPRADLYDTLVERDAAFKEDIALTRPWQPPPEPGDPEPMSLPDVETAFTRSPEHGATPYPPDPIAGGAAIRVTGLSDPVWNDLHFVPFYGDKWDPQAPLDWLKDDSFAIAARETGDPGWDPDRRRFVVPLAKAERARLFISAVMPDAAIELMKMKELVIREHGLEGWKKIERRVMAGQHWMFTPNRMVELVHAVQKPLVTPQVATIFAQRASGAVAAQLGFRTPLHPKSTARIDIDGDWIEIDDSAPSGPVVRQVSGHAFDHKPFRLDPSLASLGGDHVFADTRARRVGYVATATTRFREYLPEAVRIDPPQITVQSDRQAIWVPSATAPPAPSIRYIIPTFGWNRSGQGSAKQQSWRRGGGLRVYLDRPWFATGSNEMLAVCLPRGPADPQENADKNYVTMWGADPIWLNGNIDTVAPKASDFPLRVRAGQTLKYAIAPEGEAFGPVDPSPDGVALPGFATGPYRPRGAPATTELDIVPHAVGYDASRKLWYADIVVNPHDSYMPFIRLALARFQPASVSGLHLSAAVLADFAQLTNDRLVVTTPGANAGQRIIAVHGVGPTESQGLPDATNFRVELQRLPVGADPDLGWIKTDEGVPPLPPLGGIGNGIRSRRVAPIQRLQRLRSLDAIGRARFVEAEGLVASGRFGELFADPGLLELVRPPLLFETSIFLPLRAEGERLRLLITEYETYDTSPEPRLPGPTIDRIVFAEAIEF